MLLFFKHFSYFFRQEKTSYLFMAFLLTIMSILATLPATLIGKIIDAFNMQTLTKKNFLFLLCLMIIIAIARYICSWIYHILANKKGQAFAFGLREKYLMKLFQMDITFFEKFSKGELMSRMTTDLEVLKNAMTVVIREIFVNFLFIFILITVMILTVGVPLTFISLAILPIAIIFLNIRLSKTRTYYTKHRKIYANMTESILESVEGAEVIKAYVQEENDIKKMHKFILADIQSWKKIVKTEVIFGPLFEFVGAIATFLAFAYGTYLIIQGQLTLGALIAFSIYLTMLNQPILGLTNIFNQMNQISVATQRISEILNYTPEVCDYHQASPILDFQKIEFKDVSFKYPFDKRPVLNNINFSITKGENIGIVGPTGAGKSTIIRHLLREFNIQEGQILIDGKTIAEFKIENVRNLVGYVPQAHILFRGDVDQNLRIGDQNADFDAIEQAIQMADFKKDLAYMPKGRETHVGEFGSGLSGGQKQRLSIARALIKNPQILILDDSLSAVDAKTEKNIIEQLELFRKDKTNIIIAHRFSAIKDADQILVVENGTITERGTHEQLMHNNGWYAQQYRYQNDTLGGEN